MEADTMGRVTVEATVTNLRDLYSSQQGQLPADQVRRVVIPDAPVDTGATMLSLPTRFIQQLGLQRFAQRQIVTSGGMTQTWIYDVVRLAIQGRECNIDVLEVPDTAPALIGQIPLEMLDFVVDPQGRRLIGNPAHGGQHTVELY
jgi:predicted aspartyl protease